MNIHYSIGIDLGGTNIKALAVAEDGRILEQAQCPTNDAENSSAGFQPANSRQDAGSTPVWAEKVRNLTSTLQKVCGAPADTIGLAAPGLAAGDGRSIAFMPGRL